MKNHYIPQFIIKRFSKEMNVFNLKTGKIVEKRSPSKIFFTKDLYKDEVEISLNLNLEIPFSRLLQNKLLKEKTIEITRTDLKLIKKYMFITSIRSQDLNHFCSLLCSLESKANLFVGQIDVKAFPYNKLKHSKEMLEKMSQYDFFNQQMLALIEFDKVDFTQPYELFKDERLSIEMAALACSFYFSYVAFWDAPKDEEYILSDAGIVSEYEGFFQITGGLSASKISYLLYQMKHTKQENEKSVYGCYLQRFSMMYENYDLFNISSSRCIVAINPFFKLYDSKTIDRCIEKNGFFKDTTLKKPDIWPAVIQNRDLFIAPTTGYSFFQGLYMPTDIFIYEPKQLTKKEMIYINSLLINESKHCIGFNDPHKVFESFEYCLEHESQYKSITKPNESNESIVANYAKNLLTSKFNMIIEWCLNHECKTDVDVSLIFQELADNIYKDFNSNIYIYDYYLNMYDETYNLSQLDFLGHGDKQKKMEYLVSMYNKLLGERGGEI